MTTTNNNQSLCLITVVRTSVERCRRVQLSYDADQSDDFSVDGMTRATTS